MPKIPYNPNTLELKTERSELHSTVWGKPEVHIWDSVKTKNKTNKHTHTHTDREREREREREGERERERTRRTRTRKRKPKRIIQYSVKLSEKALFFFFLASFKTRKASSKWGHEFEKEQRRCYKTLDVCMENKERENYSNIISKNS